MLKGWYTCSSCEEPRVSNAGETVPSSCSVGDISIRSFWDLCLPRPRRSTK
uniref:Uncharacterized protein n=1 Tax=Myotis myotis TaxID=51298 RepID=A0A7J8AHU7_MYOMY|nr:hypothetical protein mMyoMyo1_000529 [Myotis myotis]